MATIRKQRGKWQAIVRRKGMPHMARSFTKKGDAATWARQIETTAERQGLSANLRLLEETMVSDIIERYRDTVVPKKRGAERETITLNAFLRTRIARLRLCELSPKIFADYRDHRLRNVKPASKCR